MSNRVVTAIGLALGAALVGVPMGIYAARRYRCDETPDTTSPENVATSINNMKGAGQ